MLQERRTAPAPWKDNLPLFPGTWGVVYFLLRPAAGRALPASQERGSGAEALSPRGGGVCGHPVVVAAARLQGVGLQTLDPRFGPGTGRPGARTRTPEHPAISLQLSTCLPSPRTRPTSLGLSELLLRNVFPRADRCTAGTGGKATSAYFEGLKDLIPPTQPFAPPPAPPPRVGSC